MYFIDKTRHWKDGHAIIKDYLEKHSKGPDGRYKDISYDLNLNGKQSFSSAAGGRYKKNLIEVLRENQDSLCCYCLRRLKQAKVIKYKDESGNEKEEETEQHITLEHIIPKGLSSADSAQVKLYRKAPFLSEKEVELTDLYEQDTFNQHSRVEPHVVSYNNIVLSCNGTFPDVVNKKNNKSKCCCNEARVRENAYPIYFHMDVADYVDYLKDGDIQATLGKDLTNEVEEMISNTKLNSDSLKHIRLVWYALRNEGKDEIIKANSSPDKRNSLLSKYLYANIKDISLAYNLHTKFLKDSQWETLMLYDTFYDIMNSIYP